VPIRTGRDSRRHRCRAHVGAAELRRRVGQTTRRALQATAVAEWSVEGTHDDGRGWNTTDPRGHGRDRSRHRGPADERRGKGIRRVETAGHVAGPLRGYRGAKRTRWILYGRPARNVSLDARSRGRTAALGPHARADQDRHAVARRASRLQYPRNDAERIARGNAGCRRDRSRAADHAPRRKARPSAPRPAHRHGRRAADGSAGTASARQLDDRTGERG